MKVFYLVATQGTHSGELNRLRRDFDVEVIVIPPPRASGSKAGIVARLVMHEVLALPRVLRVVLRDTDDVALVCSTAHYAALMAHRVAGLSRKRTRVYMFNFYLHALGKNRVVRLVLRHALTSSVGICVYSPNEVGYYSSLAPRTHVDYIPYAGQKITCVNPTDVRLGDYVFTGGYANRDYETVVAAARRLPGTEFVLVCAAANPISASVPSNVRVLRDVEPGLFYSLLAASRCVVVPMKDDVGSSGQMVALAAMQFGKLTLYTDFACVSQYFTDGITGVACNPRDVDDLCEKLSVFAQDPTVAARIGAAAQESYWRDFPPDSGWGARIAENALRFLRT